METFFSFTCKIKLTNNLLNSKIMKRLLFFLTIFFLSSILAKAQTQWTGNGDGQNWGDAANWDNGLPVTGSDVIIDFGDVLINDPVPVLGSLQLLNDASLNLSSNDENLVISGDFTVDASGKIYVGLHDLNRYSKIIVNGNYYFNGETKVFFRFYVPQIGNSYKIINGAMGSCGTNTVTFDSGQQFGFDVTLGVQCQADGILYTVTGINYTTAKSWDGEGGDNLWSTAANWDPNGVPVSTDRVVINLPSGGYCNTGSAGLTEVYALSVGDNNTLAINGDFEFFARVNVNKAANIVWNAGALKKKLGNTYYTPVDLYGTMTLNGPGTKAIENTLQFNNYGKIEFNQGTLNINDGRLYNMLGSELNINNDNLTIGYVGAGRHQFANSSIIRKTNGTGVSSINLDSFSNWESTIDCQQGTLAIGETLSNWNGTLKGNGNFQLPSGYVLDGILAPGNSPGTLAFAGDLTAGSTVKFDIDIDGTNAGTEYDQIVVSGNANLSGSIEVNLGYLPANDASFQILSAATLAGCNFPSQITSSFGGTPYTFDVVCQNNMLYLNGPGVPLSTNNTKIYDLDVYPNPVIDILTIKNNSNSKLLSLEVIDPSGKALHKIDLSKMDKVQNISLENYPAGMYLIKVNSENGSIIKKVLKK